FRPRLDVFEDRTVPALFPTNSLAVGADAGSDPKVTVLNPETGATVASFMPFEQSFRGGVSVAIGDVTGDGVADLVVAARSGDGYDDIAVGTGRGGGPRVVVFDGKTGELIRNFFAFDASFRDGVNVSGGDVDGDGTDDLVAGAGEGGAPHVRVFDGTTGGDLGSFFAFGSGDRGGVTVATVDTDGDGDAEIIVGNHGQVKKYLRTVRGFEGHELD